ncbi:hypothetical protein [Solemya elarraichensis gill symbiont]|nr:hypothetical protein [Solemya elarraichensis gill symbiont]
MEVGSAEDFQEKSLPFVHPCTAKLPGTVWNVSGGAISKQWCYTPLPRSPQLRLIVQATARKELAFFERSDNRSLLPWLERAPLTASEVMGCSAFYLQ